MCLALLWSIPMFCPILRATLLSYKGLSYAVINFRLAKVRNVVDEQTVASKKLPKKSKVWLVKK